MDEAVKAANFEALEAAVRDGGDVNGRYKRTGNPYLLVLFDTVNHPDRAWGSWECIQNRVKMVQFLISHGADTNATGSHLETPLYWACRYARHKNARVLAEHGADLTLKNTIDCTPLDLALNSTDSNEEILALFQELAPELYFSTFCTTNISPGGM